MKQVNVPVANETYDMAKKAALNAGMLFRYWVERAVISKAADEAAPAAKRGKRK